MKEGRKRPAKFVENHDGDTVTVVLDQGFYDTKQINLRLANTWAPELKDHGGHEVQLYVQGWFQSRGGAKWPFVVTTYETSTGNDLKTFERYVADVVCVKDGAHLNSDVMHYIVDQGYTGGTGAPK